MISLNDVLLAMSNIPVDDPIAEIWGRQMQGGYKIIEHTGAIPITINANGDVLLDYRIYGADGGVGEPTENLFDKNTVTDGLFLRPNGTIGTFIGFCLSDFIPVEEGDYLLYKGRSNYTGCGNCIYDYNKNFLRGIDSKPDDINKIFIESGEKYIRLSINIERKDVVIFKKGLSIPESYIPYGYKLPMTVQSANLLNSKITDVEQQVKIEPNTEYVLSRYTGLGENRMYWAIYDESDVKIYGEDFMLYSSAMRIPPKGNASYIKITIPGTAYDAVSIVKGAFINTTTAVPSSYIPYSRTDSPIYIGKNQLDAGEYVSYSDRKIYRMVDGSPTPTDPPVPLPEIPTIDGTTVIDYDGDPKPSQMYIKYKGKE